MITKPGIKKHKIQREFWQINFLEHGNLEDTDRKWEIMLKHVRK
jgi:hypothetical protein